MRNSTLTTILWAFFTLLLVGCASPNTDSGAFTKLSCSSLMDCTVPARRSWELRGCEGDVRCNNEAANRAVGLGMHCGSTTRFFQKHSPYEAWILGAVIRSPHSST